jgi:putative acetyltransferase
LADHGVRVAPDDPRRADVQQLLERHLAFAFASSPRQHVHALDTERLAHPAITFFSARDPAGLLLGVGALKELDAAHGEIKSMHTAERARRIGVGGAVLGRIIAVARERGYTWLSLETGTGTVFAPALALYTRAGFTECEPFGEYTRNPHSVCMTLEVR